MIACPGSVDLDDTVLTTRTSGAAVVEINHVLLTEAEVVGNQFEVAAVKIAPAVCHHLPDRGTGSNTMISSLPNPLNATHHRASCPYNLQDFFL